MEPFVVAAFTAIIVVLVIAFVRHRSKKSREVKHTPQEMIDLTPFVLEFEEKITSESFRQPIVLMAGEGFGSADGDIVLGGYAQKIAPIGSFALTVLTQNAKGVEFISNAFGIRGEFLNNGFHYFIPARAVASIKEGSGLAETTDRHILVPKHAALTSFLRENVGLNDVLNKVLSRGPSRDFWSPKGTILRDGSYEPDQERIIYEVMLTLAHPPSYQSFLSRLEKVKDVNTRCEEKNFPELLLSKVAYGSSSVSGNREDASHEPLTSMVRDLIRRGADVNATDSLGDSALMRACWGGHAAAVEILLGAGANRDIFNNSGKTALALATDEGHIKCCELLRSLPEISPPTRVTRTP